MRRTVAEVAASVAAGAITYAIFEYTKALGPTLRVVVAGGVAIGGIAVAVYLRRHRAEHSRSDVSVGDRISAGSDISVEDVDITGPSDETRVGTRLRSGKDARVRRVRVRRRNTE
jgi:hypothetical protein